MKLYKLLIFVSLLLFGCHSDDRTRLFRWEATDAPFDSLTEKLEWDYMLRDLTDSAFHKNVKQLHRLAEQDPTNKAKQARAHYWLARGTVAGDTTTPRMTMLTRAQSYSDSIRRPYEFNRIKHLYADIARLHIAERHRLLRECASFYESNNDLFMSAHAYVDIANLLYEVHDHEHAVNLYRNADSIYNLLNLEEYRLKNSANIAACYYELGDSARADTMMLGLLGNKLTEEDSLFHTSLLLRVYERFDRKEYLQKALGIINHHPRTDGRRALVLAKLADWHLRHSLNDSAEFYCHLCRHKLLPRDYASAYAIYYKTYGTILNYYGRNDSAFNYMIKYRQYSDSLNYAEASLEMGYREARANISNWEYELKRREEAQRFYLLISLLAIVVIGLVFTMIIRRRIHRQKLQRAECEAELERNRRELAYSQLVMTEKDNLLSTLMEDITKLRKQGNLTAREAELLKQNIRVHQSGKNEWQNFKVLFEQLHPAFSHKLREQHPGLTDGDVRLASYLRIGLSSKQIARMLMLQPESVKKNRTRLRTRLGLSQDEGLEEYLRKFPSE